MTITQRQRVLASLLAIAANGCTAQATICRITSEPTGAAFQLGEHSGTTPAEITLQSGRHRIEFRCGLSGYQPATLQVVPQSSTYPYGFHAELAKTGEGISTVKVDRTPPTLPPKPDESHLPKNAPREDNGRTYWLR